ncbi:MAG: radical SAM protein [Candidatus Omnitrophota bacterium]|nr:radical SAM protein [Candidatus Omnitrophota bacterium]
MSADVFLINPLPDARGINEATIEAPLGILYIASFLESNGLTCEVIDANAISLKEDDLIARVVRAAPSLVGISVNAFTYSAALSYAKKIKNSLPAATVILGGPQPTAAPEFCLEDSNVDAVVRGEGEAAVCAIAGNLKARLSPFKDVPGVVYRSAGKLIFNPPARRITGLDSLPFPAYHLLPSLKHYNSRTRKRPFMGIITSRGCPYRCSFCSKDVFGDTVTFRSPENVISEIEFLAKDMGIKQIDILDDNFTLDRARCEEICRLVIGRSLKLAINLQSGVRVENMDKEMLLLFKRAGVFKIALGVESADEDVLRGARKKADLDKILKISSLARESGIVVVGFFMIGLPGDNPGAMRRTLDFAKRMDPHIANFMITVPFYGTSLYRTIEEKGRFLVDTKRGASMGFYGGEAFFEMGDIKREDVIYWYQKSYRDFYFRISKAIDLVSTIRTWHELRWFFSVACNIMR